MDTHRSGADQTTPPGLGRTAAGPAAGTWEFLVLEDMHGGPAMALVDLLRTVNLVATLRDGVGARGGVATGVRPRAGQAGVHPRSDLPLSWQWRGAQGPVSRVGLPVGPRPRRRWPDVIVCGGWHAGSGPHLDRMVARDHEAARRMAAVHARGGQVLTVYNGVALAGAAGLLEGRRAVVPWPFVPSVSRHAPGLRHADGQPWVEEDRVWSLASPAGVIDVGLQILQALGMRDVAESARAVLCPEPDRQRLVPVAAREVATRVGPGAMERARRHLEAHLHEPYSLAATARAAAVSERSLLRHFREVYGRTPLQMLHAMRVMRARMLLETTYLAVETIAERCGWQDVSTLRQVFLRETGMTLAAYRDRFSLREERRRWGRDLG